MKSTRLCLACGKAFVPLLHVPRQRYCCSEECQRARRRDWQRNRLRNDSDNRDNLGRGAGEKARAPIKLLARISGGAPGVSRAQLQYAVFAQCAAESQSICKKPHLATLLRQIALQSW